MNNNVQIVEIIDKLTKRLIAVENKLTSVKEDINKDVPLDNTITRLAMKLAINIADVQKGDKGDSIQGEQGEIGAQGPQGEAGKDGKDGAPGRDGKDGAAGPQGPQGEAGAAGSIASISPEEVRNHLELLTGDDRLDASAIKGLEAVVKKNLPAKSPTSFVLTRGQVKAYDLSASLNGVLTTFNIPAAWRVIDIKLSSLPVLRETTDWTWTPQSVTFTSQIQASTDLAAGQTCIVIYAEA